MNFKEIMAKVEDEIDSGMRENYLREAIDILTKKEPCTWKEDEDGNWETSCGEMFTFTAGGPKDEFAYCPYCSNSIIAVIYTSPLDEPEE